MWIILFASILIFASNNEVLAGECDTFADLKANLGECCTAPKINDTGSNTKIDEIVKKIKQNGNITNKYLLNCKILQSIFTEEKIGKDNSFDRDSFVKMMSLKLKDPSWIEAFKNTFEQCQKTITENAAKIQNIFSQAPFELKKEECDPQYIIMSACLTLNLFANCPNTALKATDANRKNCESIRAAFQTCGSNVDVLKNLIINTGIINF